MNRRMRTPGRRPKKHAFRNERDGAEWRTRPPYPLRGGVPRGACRSALTSGRKRRKTAGSAAERRRVRQQNCGSTVLRYCAGKPIVPSKCAFLGVYSAKPEAFWAVFWGAEASRAMVPRKGWGVFRRPLVRDPSARRRDRNHVRVRRHCAGRRTWRENDRV